jgi:hypothetical protein
MKTLLLIVLAILIAAIVGTASWAEFTAFESQKKARETLVLIKKCTAKATLKLIEQGQSKEDAAAFEKLLNDIASAETYKFANQGLLSKIHNLSTFLKPQINKR